MEIIDPDGDLVITLQPAAEPFAEWETATRPYSIADLMPPDEIYDEDTEFLVSSKHLCLASPRFHKMLTGDWLEARTIYPDGRRRVSMEGFHVDAFRIVMNVIHGLNDSNINVPRTISLDQLGKIAVLVDDLQCQGTIAILSEIWIDKLKGSVSDTYDRNLIIWIFVSSVFGQAEVFKQVTRTATLKSEGEVPTLGLPIRGKITDTIMREREDRIGEMTAKLLDLFERLRQAPEENKLAGPSTKLHCGNTACRAMLVGSFVIEMPSLSILDSQPIAPFAGLSLEEIADRVQKMATPQWDDPWREPGYYCDYRGYIPHSCNIRDLLRPSIDSIIKGVQGLDINILFPEKK